MLKHYGDVSFSEEKTTSWCSKKKHLPGVHAEVCQPTHGARLDGPEIEG